MFPLTFTSKFSDSYKISGRIGSYPPAKTSPELDDSLHPENRMRKYFTSEVDIIIIICCKETCVAMGRIKAIICYCFEPFCNTNTAKICWVILLGRVSQQSELLLEQLLKVKNVFPCQESSLRAQCLKCVSAVFPQELRPI